MTFKKILLGAVAGLLFAASASAQGVNQVPQVGAISNIFRNPSYSATSVALVAAASATDIMCIAASATRNISIRRITIDGTAGTTINTPFLIYRRNALDTGGTAATSLALPVAAAMSSTDPASTATLIAYTANPTVNDASPALLYATMPTIGTATTATVPTQILFGTGVDMFQRGADLVKGSTQQICINLNGATISTPSLTISIEWQESY